MLGVKSSKLMTFIHFLLTLKKKKEGQFGIIQWKYSRAVSRVNIFKSTDDLYTGEKIPHASFVAFSFRRESRS